MISVHCGLLGYVSAESIPHNYACLRKSSFIVDWSKLPNKQALISVYHCTLTSDMMRLRFQKNKKVVLVKVITTTLATLPFPFTRFP